MAFASSTGRSSQAHQAEGAQSLRLTRRSRAFSRPGPCFFYNKRVYTIFEYFLIDHRLERIEWTHTKCVWRKFLFISYGFVVSMVKVFLKRRYFVEYQVSEK